MCTQLPCCSAVFIVNDNLGWASKVGVAVTCECDLHHGLILALALGCKPPPPQTTPPPPPPKKGYLATKAIELYQVCIANFFSNCEW